MIHNGSRAYVGADPANAGRPKQFGRSFHSALLRAHWAGVTDHVISDGLADEDRKPVHSNLATAKLQRRVRILRSSYDAAFACEHRVCCILAGVDMPCCLSGAP